MKDKQNANQFDVAYIAKLLKMRKDHRHSTVLVLGSRAGGLFRNEKFYETLKQFGKPDFQELPQIQQFAQCYHLLTRKTDPGFGLTDIDSILTSALKDVNITDADICLAELVKIGLFDTIITTNVDNILEDSLEYVGLKEIHNFEVFSLRTHAGKDQFRFEKRGSCRIVKVFGQLTAREYTIRRSGYLHQNPEIKQRLEELLTRDIIAIGMDPVWDAELYLALQVQGNSFWFINEEKPNVDTPFYHIGEAKDARYFTGIAASYQYFMQSLHSAVVKEVSDDKRQFNNTNNNKNLEINQINGIDNSLITPQIKNTIPISSSSKNALNIFLSYASEDKFLANKLVEHMSALKHEGIIAEIYNHNIQAGKVKTYEIDSRLNHADIILLLVTASFIASEHIYTYELKSAIELQKLGRVRVIPVILRPVYWEGTSFGTLEPLPPYGKPVSNWTNRDEALLATVNGIRKIAQELQEESQ